MDPVEIYERSFEPHEKGYLYYSSRWSGGKLITTAEHDEFVNAFASACGRRNIVILSATIIAIIALGKAISLGSTAQNILMYTIVAAFVIRILWLALAPARATRHRAVIAPPRSGTEINKRMAQITSWPLLFLMFLFGLSICTNYLDTPPQNFSSWIWLAMGAFLLIGSIWQAVIKLRYRGG